MEHQSGHCTVVSSWSHLWSFIKSLVLVNMLTAESALWVGGITVSDVLMHGHETTDHEDNDVPSSWDIFILRVGLSLEMNYIQNQIEVNLRGALFYSTHAEIWPQNQESELSCGWYILFWMVKAPLSSDRIHIPSQQCTCSIPACSYVGTPD